MGSQPPPRHVVVRHLDEATARARPYRVEGTPAQRLALVWPLTVEACSLAPGFDSAARMRRNVVRVIHPRV